MNTNLTISILNEPTLNGLTGRKGLYGFDSRCAHAHSVLSVFFIVLSASLSGVMPMAPCRDCGLNGIVAELVDAM